MSKIRRIEVFPGGAGWHVRGHQGEPDRAWERQRDAERYARELAHKAGGGEIVIHSRSGRIVDVRTVGEDRKGDPGSRIGRSLRGLRS